MHAGDSVYPLTFLSHVEDVCYHLVLCEDGLFELHKVCVLPLTCLETLLGSSLSPATLSGCVILLSPFPRL